MPLVSHIVFATYCMGLKNTNLSSNLTYHRHISSQKFSAYVTTDVTYTCI
jgi:hypothetical protein